MRNISKELDYKISKLDDRMEEIEKILSIKDAGGLNEFERYFDTRYKCGLNSNDALSEDNNYCKALEQMADYILGSEEVRNERKNNQQYRFYMDKKEFERRSKKEKISIEGMRSKAKNKNGFEDGDNIIDFLKKKDNFLKPKTQKITKEDLKKNDRCGEILRDYQQYDDYLTGLLMFPTNGDGYKIRRIKGSIKDDMIYTKDSLNGVFGYKLRHEVKSDCSPDWSLFNWDDKEQIKCLIYIQREFMIDDDLSLLIVDLENLAKRCIERDIISPKEVKVYEMIRQGYTNIEISQELGVNKQRISNMVTSIVNKLHREQKKRVVK